MRRHPRSRARRDRPRPRRRLRRARRDDAIARRDPFESTHDVKAGRPPRGGRPWRREPFEALRFERSRRLETERVTDLGFEIAQHHRIFLQPLARVLAALADAFGLVRVPGARLFDDPLLDAGVENGAGLRDALAVEHVELGLTERRRQLVLHDLDLGADADRLRALLDRVLAADVEADGGVELQRAAAGRGFGVPKHYAYLFADLIDENDHAAGTRDRRRELAQRLRHEPRLQAGQRVAHVAVELGARDERGDRVDHDDVDGVGAHQRLRDLERLLTRVGLGDQQLVRVDTQLLGVDGIQRVLRVDERGDTAETLSFGHDVQGERGLTRRFRAVDLDDPAARQAADAERYVQRERACRDDRDLLQRTARAQAHDRALAELALDRGDGELEGLLSIALGFRHARAPYGRPGWFAG